MTASSNKKLNKNKADDRSEIIRFNLKKINEILSKSHTVNWEILTTVVDIIFVSEVLLKKELYTKNSFLVYRTLPKEPNELAKIINKEIIDSETINLETALKIYRHVFPRKSINKFGNAFNILIPIRNEVIHGTTKVSFNAKDVKEVLISLFAPLLDIAEKLYGKIELSGKPEKVITSKDIDAIFIKNIREKLNVPIQSRNLFLRSQGLNFTTTPDSEIFTSSYLSTPTARGIFSSPMDISPFSSFKELCPRCNNFALTSPSFSILSAPLVFQELMDIYSCDNCHLELTKQEYQTIQKNNITRDLGKL